MLEHCKAVLIWIAGIYETLFESRSSKVALGKSYGSPTLGTAAAMTAAIAEELKPLYNNIETRLLTLSLQLSPIWRSEIASHASLGELGKRFS